MHCVGLLSDGAGSDTRMDVSTSPNHHCLNQPHHGSSHISRQNSLLPRMTVIAITRQHTALFPPQFKTKLVLHNLQID